MDMIEGKRKKNFIRDVTEKLFTFVIYTKVAAVSNTVAKPSRRHH
jgi:hypothetical protein